MISPERRMKNKSAISKRPQTNKTNINYKRVTFSPSGVRMKPRQRQTSRFSHRGSYG